MTSRTLWFIVPENGLDSDIIDEISFRENEKEAKELAKELAEGNYTSYFIFKAQSVWLVDPPEEIPATITKINKK